MKVPSDYQRAERATFEFAALAALVVFVLVGGFVMTATGSSDAGGILGGALAVLVWLKIVR